jgi:hypothetical protein
MIMRTILFITVLTILISACGKNSKSRSMSHLQTTQKSNSASDTISSLIITDGSYYSSSFLKSLDPEKGHWKFRLDSNKFIFNNRDTIIFPDFLPLNKSLLLIGKKDNLRINLYIKRVLISTIDYKIEVIINSNPPAIKSGLADLSPYFFVQSKKDVIDSTYNITNTVDYWDNNSDYLTSIRIGKTRDNKKLLGKVELKLKDLEINSDNSPILIEK